MDPLILTIFGQPPFSVDLSASTTAYDNSVVIVLSILAVLAVACRVWARKIKAAPIGVDDTLVFVALALELATMVLTILGGLFGSGKHVWSLNMDHLKMIFKVLYGYTFVYGAAAAAIKLSFVFFFARIFDTGVPVRCFGLRNYLRIAVWTGAILACSYAVMVWTVMLGVCRPINYFWDQYTEPTSGSCIDTTLFFLVAGIINMLIDIAILLIPIPCLLKLEVSRMDRLMLICIFMLGGFVCIASVMRIHYLQVLRTSTDITHSMGSVFIWSSVEPAIGIVSSCLICVRPVVRKMLSKMYGLPSQRQSGITSSRKQRSRISDGHPLDDEIRLVVCASSGVRKEVGTPSEDICVTREVDLRGGSMS